MQPETATLSSANPQTDKRKFLITALNGTAIYVLTYYLVWGLHQAAEVGMAWHFGLRGTWSPSRIAYTMADNEWWPTAIIGAHGVGPLVSLVLGAIAFIWYWRSERARRGNFKLMLLWVAFHCCNAVLGALLADTITQSGFWYVPEWLFRIGPVANTLLAIMAGLGQVALGYFGALAFLQAHDSRTVMRYPNRRLMVLATLFTPWAVGGAFIALTKLSYLSIHEGLHLVVMGLLVVPMAMGCLKDFFSDTVRRPQPTYVVWGLVGLAVGAALVWRVALSPSLLF